MAANDDWVLQRLPAGVSFAKNGVSATPAAMVSAALADHAGDTDFQKRRRALADLLEIVVSDQVYRREKVGDYQYDTGILQERIDALRAEADAEDQSVGGQFRFVTARWKREPATDEYSE